jgi:L-alanine-DL-glutamate epimerase-like enolase superfamily enzyme
MIKTLRYQLENKVPFRIAHGVRKFTDTLLVRIEKDGIIGYGEAAHVPYYPVKIEDSQKQIDRHSTLIHSLFGENPADVWHILREEFSRNHFALSAVDIAHYDWLSKKSGQPLWKYLEYSDKNLPKSSFTIGIDTAENMIIRIKKSDFPIFKIKLGSENDLDLIRNIKNEISAPVRVDVNAGWSDKDGEYNALETEKTGVEFIEQPFSAQSYQASSKLREKLNIPLIADESCVVMEDVDKCKGNFDGINIKLSKCGGIYPATQMIKEARENGMKIMLGCMVESSVAISALAHLASQADYVDLDGSSMIKNDPASGVEIRKGEVFFTKKNGHGAVWNSELIE